MPTPSVRASLPRGRGRCPRAPTETNAGASRYLRRDPLGQVRGYRHLVAHPAEDSARGGVHGGPRNPVLRTLRAGPGFVRLGTEHVPRLPGLRSRMLRGLLEPGGWRVSCLRPVPPGRSSTTADRRRRHGGRGTGCRRRPLRRPSPRGSCSCHLGSLLGHGAATPEGCRAGRDDAGRRGSRRMAHRAHRHRAGRSPPEAPPGWAHRPGRERGLGRCRRPRRRCPGCLPAGAPRRSRAHAARHAGPPGSDAGSRPRHGRAAPDPRPACDRAGDAAGTPPEPRRRAAAGHPAGHPAGNPAPDAAPDTSTRQADRGRAADAEADTGANSSPNARPDPRYRHSLNVRAGAGAARTRRSPAVLPAGACTTGTSASRTR
jgi:hypothetical protein